MQRRDDRRMTTLPSLLYRSPSDRPPPVTRESAAAPRLQTCLPGQRGRAEIEGYIRDVYRRRYGADVEAFAPVLVALRDAGDAIVAAAGYRPADRGALFLERYLPAPVETLLAPAPPRAQIVEVGHLAATRAGEGRRLIVILGPHLAAQGFRWVVGTLTQELRSLFLRLGVAPLTLGIADPARLGAEAAQWGSYYDHRPVVLAGQIQQALQLFARRAVGA
jgi:hypothetical protein